MAASDLVTTTLDELMTRIDLAHDRFAGLLGEVDGDLPVGATWRAGEVLGHVTNVVNRYNEPDASRLADTPRGVDEVNRRELETLAGRDTADLLGVLAGEMATFRETWGALGDLPLDTAMPFHGGGAIDLQALLTNLVGEFLVHGGDVAQAAGRPWVVEDRDAQLLAAFIGQAIGAYVRQDNTVELRARFDLDGVAPWVLVVDGPHAEVRAPRPDDRPDVVLAGPPLPVVLWIYQRHGWPEVEAAGVRPTGGDHPDLAPSVFDLFEEP